MYCLSHLGVKVPDLSLSLPLITKKFLSQAMNFFVITDLLWFKNRNQWRCNKREEKHRTQLTMFG